MNLDIKYKRTQHPTFAKWIDENIHKALTVLDIGSGGGWYHQFLRKSYLVTIDADPKGNPDFVLDVGKTKLPFDKDLFPTVLMFDVIEHMEKEEGLFALEEAKRVCSNVLFLLTPLKWDDNSKSTNDKRSFYYQNEYNYHRSLWTVDDFVDFVRIDKPFKSDEYFFGYWKNEI